MFGLALRSYQRKIQRLTESASHENRSLWEAVLEFLTDNGPTRRDHLLERFRYDDEPTVLAALNDLITSGLVYASGRSETAVYGATTDAARAELVDDDLEDTIATLVWGLVFRNPGITASELLRTSQFGTPSTTSAIARLLDDGRVTRTRDSDDAPLTAAPYVIPLGARAGWEAAVLDHFYSVANAVAAKARALATGNGQDSRVGGSTIHFGVYPGHPLEAEVYGSLGRIRVELNELWQRVVAFNQANPIADEAATRVTVYFGQYVREPAAPEARGVPDDTATEHDGAKQ
jgi:hypothetical protein